MVASAPRRQRRRVAWYGGGRRVVEVVPGVGPWDGSGAGLVPLRGVLVHDRTGRHRDEYCVTTAVGWMAAPRIATDTGRWNIATTFAERRSCFGLETTRGRTPRTVLRVASGLFGLYTVVAAWSAQWPARRRVGVVVAWLGQQDVRFSDGRTAVRRWRWVEGMVALPGPGVAFSKRSRPFRELLLAGLTPAP